jgi:signal transduction histidine kinase
MRFVRHARVRSAILLAALSLRPLTVVAADGGQKKVLVVYSTRRDTQLPTLGDREVPRLLEQGLGVKPDYYSEFIDAARFPDPQYSQAFREYLSLKYRGARFDLVMASHKRALDFVAAHRDELFPGTPIVFLTEQQGTARPANAAGVVAARDYRGTLALALQLQPDTTRVFVVSGSSESDKAVERIAAAQLKSFAPPVALTFLSNLSTEELERRVATLPEHAIIYYLIFYQDAAGLNVTPLEYLDRISAIANRPVYSWVDSTLSHGVVGGHLLSIDAQLAAMSDVAVRVLRGERADSIPVAALDLSVNQVDWRQLQRWGIPEARVPPGSVIRFREATLFERYGWYISGLAALMVAETALIAGLLVQGARRRRAEEQVRARETELRASYERIRDLGARLLVAQEAERSRIARELHDDISQQMTLLAIDLQLLHDASGDPGEDRDKLAREALDRTHAVARSVHDISHRLHPAKLRLVGLVSALGSLQRELPASDRTITFVHENVPKRVPNDLALCLYRIAQEALRNAIEHGGAHTISMRLQGTSNGLALTVVDDGKGFEVDRLAGRGLGLVSMRERLEPFGGTLTVTSRPGAGTRVEATVPFIVAPWTPEPRLQELA